MILNQTNQSGMQEIEGGAQTARRSSFKKQKIAAIILAAAVVLLIGVLILVNYGISVYPLEDTWTVDGETFSETYYIRKKNGAYALYNKDGKLMEVNEISTKNQQAATDTPYVIYIAETSGNQYMIDTSTGSFERYAVVDYGNGEELGFKDRVLIYPQIQENGIYSIEVKNEHGGYTFYRGEDGEFVLKGYEKSTATYSQEAIASLCSACGYTLTLRKLDLKGEVARLPDGRVDYAAYGLPAYDAEGNLTSDAVATFTIVKANYTNKVYSASDVSYTVYVGERTLPGTGYYMQLAGRDAIYVADTTVEHTVLGSVESMMAPKLIQSMNTSTYLMVKNFMFGKIDGKLDDMASSDEFAEKFPPIVAFSFSEIDDRLGTIYTVSPYVYPEDFKNRMEGYALDDNNVSTMLLQLFQLGASKCLRLGLNSETLAEFGLDENVYYLTFDTSDNLPTTLLISEKTERGTYYIASTVCDMIVEVDQSALGFLEWEYSDWYMQYFFQYNISHISSLNIQIGDKNYNFSLDNLMSYAFYENAKGVMTRINLTTGKLSSDANGNLFYTDSTGVKRAVKVFDLQKGGFYIRLDPSDKNADPLYYSYYKYLITQDRNGDIEIKIVEKLEDGTEQSYTYELGNKNDQTPAYTYRMVYVAENGEEFDVAGAYNNGDGERISAYYQMTYWVENEKGEWERHHIPNLATNLMLRDSAGKLYQIPVVSNNLSVSCDQYTGNASGKLNYETVYTYKTDTGLIETASTSGVDNFRRLFGMFNWFSLEAQIDPDAFLKDYGKTPQEYIKGATPYATFSYTVRDMADTMNLVAYPNYPEDGSTKKPIPEEKLYHTAHEQNVVVRLYQYGSGAKSIITVSVDGAEELAIFYVQTGYCTDILETAEKVLNGTPIEPEGEIVEIKEIKRS